MTLVELTLRALPLIRRAERLAVSRTVARELDEECRRVDAILAKHRPHEPLQIAA